MDFLESYQKEIISRLGLALHKYPFTHQIHEVVFTKFLPEIISGHHLSGHHLSGKEFHSLILTTSLYLPIESPSYNMTRFNFLFRYIKIAQEVCSGCSESFIDFMTILLRFILIDITYASQSDMRKFELKMESLGWEGLFVKVHSDRFGLVGSNPWINLEKAPWKANWLDLGKYMIFLGADMKSLIYDEKIKVSDLVKLGFNINTRNDDGEPFLFELVRKEKWNRFSEFLDAGADPFQTNTEEQSLADIIDWRGLYLSRKDLRPVLENLDPVLLFKLNDNGETILFDLTHENTSDSILNLIEKGINPAILNHQGHTFFYVYNCKEYASKIVDEFIEQLGNRGFNFDSPGFFISVFHCYKEQGDDLSKTCESLFHLLDRGANLNDKDSDCNTLLHYVLDFRPNFNFCCYERSLPRGYNEEHFDLGEILENFSILHNANWNLQNNKGKTPLLILSETIDYPIKLYKDPGLGENLMSSISELMEYDADPTIQDNLGHTFISEIRKSQFYCQYSKKIEELISKYRNVVRSWKGFFFGLIRLRLVTIRFRKRYYAPGGIGYEKSLSSFISFSSFSALSQKCN